MTKHMTAGVTGLGVVLIAAQALAAPIAFDPFPIGTGDYTNAVNIVGQGPTGSPIVGFTGSWAGTTGLAKPSSTGLDAPNVEESDGSLSFAGWNDAVVRNIDRSFTEQAAVMTNGATVYWSGIVSLSGTDADANAYITWSDDTAPLALLVRFGIMGGRLKVQLRSTTMDLGAFTPGAAHHIVVEGTINVSDNNDEAKVWIDPELSDVVNGTNTATNRSDISFVANTGFDNLEITAQNISAALTAGFDELVHTTDINDLNLPPRGTVVAIR
jgi:hypothetical protein